jgi:long-subunit acyl-CoA synthetase (AMP-forming)
VAVIGEKRKYLSALIVPAFAELKAWARDKGIQCPT